MLRQKECSQRRPSAEERGTGIIISGTEKTKTQSTSWGAQQLLPAVVVMVVAYFLFFRGNIQSILYKIRHNDAGTPSSTALLDELTGHLLTVVGEEQMKKSTLIDLGCGEGEVLVHLFKHFMEAKGIELSERRAKQAKHNTRELSTVTIEQADMTQYKFEDMPTVFFLYEPLWRVEPQSLALDMYRRMFANIKQDVSPENVYFAHVSGTHGGWNAYERHDIDESFQEEVGLRAIKSSKYGAFLVWRMITIMDFA